MLGSRPRQHYGTGEEALVGPQIGEVSAYLRKGKRRRPPYVVGNKEPSLRSRRILPDVLSKTVRGRVPIPTT